MNSLETIAKEILFTGITVQQIYDMGWEFRKNKTTEDIKKAVKKAKSARYGMYKAEYELEWLELFLKEILKKKKIIKEKKIWTK